MKALLAVAMLVLQVNPASTGRASGESTRFVFAWRGVPVGTVSLSLEAGRFTYTSRHLHVREGRAGERVREVTLDVEATGRVAGADAVPQALWLWHGPPPEGCVKGREELSGQEGPHCVTSRSPTSAEGTMLGARFRASYDARGRLQALDVGESRFTVAAPGERLRTPPELFADGVPVEGGVDGALKLVPSKQARPTAPVPDRLPEMTDWTPDAARALSRKVHAAFPDKGPTAADWRSGGEGEAGGCLAHALRFASLARASGQRVGLVHGLLVVDGGPARPHAWVRVAVRGGGTLDLDPTSLDPVRADTHLPLALVAPEGPGLEAGERWLALLRGDWRVVRATRRE
ncbi:transglutaminase domain-containing protein [Corallococcus praedator]|uniref:Transglutaminase domain-containing protein n=1 Tax=Corallococcus praedator TaxID=2316724 RepID=A0ABX9QPJ7_9BACT|nr:MULTISPECIES: lasso peptide biosynthesis protein [Corallococcus]RKH20875.1 transglutaminase domain-containing protein [Corallococcus sp. CA047B]RKH35429.1 transglutaminase domain-containing protein [Corallococcus sp. CA031C]RKI15690.1 transglutaminase domain-containing protein [Corallococcus praedator]